MWCGWWALLTYGLPSGTSSLCTHPFLLPLPTSQALAQISIPHVCVCSSSWFFCVLCPAEGRGWLSPVWKFQHRSIARETSPCSFFLSQEGWYCSLLCLGTNLFAGESSRAFVISLAFPGSVCLCSTWAPILAHLATSWAHKWGQHPVLLGSRGRTEGGQSGVTYLCGNYTQGSYCFVFDLILMIMIKAAVCGEFTVSLTWKAVWPGDKWLWIRRNVRLSPLLTAKHLRLWFYFFCVFFNVLKGLWEGSQKRIAHCKVILKWEKVSLS